MTASADVALILATAARGLRVFPCRPREKRPIVADWPNVATTDAGQIPSARSLVVQKADSQPLPHSDMSDE